MTSLFCVTLFVIMSLVSYSKSQADENKIRGMTELNKHISNLMKYVFSDDEYDMGTNPNSRPPLMKYLVKYANYTAERNPVGFLWSRNMLSVAKQVLVLLLIPALESIAPVYQLGREHISHADYYDDRDANEFFYLVYRKLVINTIGLPELHKYFLAQLKSSKNASLYDRIVYNYMLVEHDMRDYIQLLRIYTRSVVISSTELQLLEQRFVRLCSKEDDPMGKVLHNLKLWVLSPEGVIAPQGPNGSMRLERFNLDTFVSLVQENSSSTEERIVGARILAVWSFFLARDLTWTVFARHACFAFLAKEAPNADTEQVLRDIAGKLHETGCKVKKLAQHKDNPRECAM